MSIKCYAAAAPGQLLKTFTYEPNPLGRNDVKVKISHCGICHSDLHLIDNDWQTSLYPLVPGHEIVGTVVEKGPDVERLTIGQRVGIGWQSNSCGVCEWCLKGEENLCSTQEATCVGNFGGFAEAIQVNSRFVFPIPEELSSANAAPLFCGGVTVYSPLRLHVTNPNMRIGIIGIGGLGHLAIQFAAAFGCEVTAFSHSPGKEQMCKKLGAHHFILTDNLKSKPLSNSFDLILSTVAVALDWQMYVDMLRPRGKLCFVGVPPSPLTLPVFNLIVGRKMVCGSNIGSCPEISEMLSFCVRHKIDSESEIMSMHEVNEAITKVRNNDVRYRVVLKNE